MEPYTKMIDTEESTFNNVNLEERFYTPAAEPVYNYNLDAAYFDRSKM